jgi:hypothetical protein
MSAIGLKNRYTPNGVKDGDRVASATVFFTVGSKDGDRVT